MSMEQTRAEVVERLEQLNKVAPTQRKAQVEANSLKAEVATLTAKLAVADSKVSNAEFANLIHVAINPW